jgi:hypothetical protein
VRWRKSDHKPPSARAAPFSPVLSPLSRTNTAGVPGNHHCCVLAFWALGLTAWQQSSEIRQELGLISPSARGPAGRFSGTGSPAAALLEPSNIFLGCKITVHTRQRANGARHGFNRGQGAGLLRRSSGSLANVAARGRRADVRQPVDRFEGSSHLVVIPTTLVRQTSDTWPEQKLTESPTNRGGSRGFWPGICPKVAGCMALPGLPEGARTPALQDRSTFFARRPCI